MTSLPRSAWMEIWSKTLVFLLIPVISSQLGNLVDSDSRCWVGHSYRMFSKPKLFKTIIDTLDFSLITFHYFITCFVIFLARGYFLN